MKAADFSYESPSTLDAALRLLADPERDVMALAGGQSLMPMMNFRLALPQLLIDLNHIAELTGITEHDDAIIIGAMTRYVELENSDLIAAHIPLIKLALPHIAHAAIRNRGTIGGSVALADPAAELPGVLLALNATIVTVSVEGERRIPISEFFFGIYETALNDNEIIKQIIVPKAADDARFAFYELARRHGDYAMIGTAIAARGTNPIRKIRIAYFGISDRAMLIYDSENTEIASSGDDDALIDAILKSISNLEFTGDLHASEEMKKHLAQVVLKRAMAEL